MRFESGRIPRVPCSYRVTRQRKSAETFVRSCNPNPICRPQRRNKGSRATFPEWCRLQPTLSQGWEFTAWPSLPETARPPRNWMPVHFVSGRTNA